MKNSDMEQLVGVKNELVKQAVRQKPGRVNRGVDVHMEGFKTK